MVIDTAHCRNRISITSNIAQKSTKRHCRRACDGILRQHKMKITLATAFSLCAFVALVKARSFAGLVEETEDLEGELNELESKMRPRDRLNYRSG